MDTVCSRKELYELLPVMDVVDGVVISKRGDMTFGWEVSLPGAYSLAEEDYDIIVNTFVSALKVLPAWTMVHRQDVFTYDRYRGVYTGSYLSDCYNRHFEGRRFLRHRQFLFLTFCTKGSAMKSNSQTAAFGIRFTAPLPTEEDVASAFSKAEEFISVLSSQHYLSFRRLEQQDLEGADGREGLMDSYLNFFQDSPVDSDYVIGPDIFNTFDRRLLAFKVSGADCLPGTVSNVRSMNDPGAPFQLFASFFAPLGVFLDCEHVFNQYILVPSQDEALAEQDRRRRKMTSGSRSADNRVNAKELGEFIEDVHVDGVQLCYSHLNILAFCPEKDYKRVLALVRSGVTTTGVRAVRAMQDVPSLFFAGFPGGESEIGTDNLYLSELVGTVCLGLNEGFGGSIDDGSFLISDRIRKVPVRLDLGLAARAHRWIANFNSFVLGPSGSGKSFLVNFILQQCYDNGENIFVIDKGGSYEGLCSIIRELSGGRDGVYLSWDENHRFSFNPFIGFGLWLTPEGGLSLSSGALFFVSLLSTLWTPEGGWRSENVPILYEIIRLFVIYAKRRFRGGDLPVFDDFYHFVASDILRMFEPGSAEPLVVGENPVRREEFDVSGFLRAVSPYSAKGAYSFLLNERNPKDMFSNRFSVFEVDSISDGDATFYSACVLCMVNGFDLKMRRAPGFKRLVIDEAWAAITNETMGPYLKSLWKQARKYQTGAMVISQELDDILASDVIKEAILANSDTKILLDQSKNAQRFDELASLLGLSEIQQNQVLSLCHKNDHEVYIGMKAWSNVFVIEASKQQALAFESDKEEKAPLLRRAEKLGSIRKAINELVGKVSS
ncbi:MAG: TraG family conjugative transposon ATPase [Bacteroidales bacterium]|nr:TraG family conjugative transposon ATPase [Bacteroidales bacterium]